MDVSKMCHQETGGVGYQPACLKGTRRFAEAEKSLKQNQRRQSPLPWGLNMLRHHKTQIMGIIWYSLLQHIAAYCRASVYREVITLEIVSKAKGIPFIKVNPFIIFCRSTKDPKLARFYAHPLAVILRGWLHRYLTQCLVCSRDLPVCYSLSALAYSYGIWLPDSIVWHRGKIPQPHVFLLRMSHFKSWPLSFWYRTKAGKLFGMIHWEISSLRPAHSVKFGAIWMVLKGPSLPCNLF